MPRPIPARRTQLLGLAVATMSALLIVGAFSLATGDSLAEDRVAIRAHFGSVSGLNKNSDVVLSGKKVGIVEEVAFVTTFYPCSPATEDTGRNPIRTNDCEEFFFCAPQPQGDGLCAILMPYSGSNDDYEDEGCLVDEQCDHDEMCVNGKFAEFYANVDWLGPANTCVPYQTEHHRVEVTMAIEADKVAFIRTDSRASVASKGPLGDQQVNITVGDDVPVPAGGRVQSSPTLIEELNRFRARIGVVTDRFSGNFKGLRELGGSITDDDAPPRDLRSGLRRYSDSTNDIVTQQGQLGELFQIEARDEFIVTLQELQKSSDDAGRDVARWRRKFVPGIRDAHGSMSKLADGAESALDPKSEEMGARLVLDERMGLDVAERIRGASGSIESAREGLASARTGVNDARQQLDAGEGTLGELVRSPSMYYAFTKYISLFDMLDRNDAIKGGARTVIEANDEWEGSDPQRDAASARPASKEPAPAAEPAGPPPPPRGPPPPPDGS